MYIQNTVKCPICNSKQTFLFHNKVWNLPNGKVYRCIFCDVTFIHPTMDNKKERLFYLDYNKHVKSRGMTLTESRAEFHKLSRPMAKERHELLKKHILRSDKILEIGSSTGAFLEILKKEEGLKNLNAIEPCLENREYSKRFANEVFENIQDVPKNKKFDIILMFHTFEHLKNPTEFLKACKSHLELKGKVLIEVPLIDDPLISLYNCSSFRDFYFQSMHPYVYSIKSLRHVFLKSGFKEKAVVYYQRYGLDNHLVWLSKGVPGGDRQLQKIFSNIQYTEALQRTGKTDTVFYLAQKK